jgi:hypothetical protein
MFLTARDAQHARIFPIHPPGFRAVQPRPPDAPEGRGCSSSGPHLATRAPNPPHTPPWRVDAHSEARNRLLSPSEVPPWPFPPR